MDALDLFAGETDSGKDEEIAGNIIENINSEVYVEDNSESKYDNGTTEDNLIEDNETINGDTNENTQPANIKKKDIDKPLLISLDTMSPSVRFYSHVRLASALDHQVMLLAKGPDSYPWSKHFRQTVLVQHKTPIPPYFNQLPSGERPDTLIVHSIPAIWFLDEDDDDINDELDDRLYNFTQRGATILEAAFLRFGSVKAVDLLFEMVNRDQEDSLTFDVYVQFITFEAFSKAFFALNEAVLYDDRNPDAQTLCTSKYDTSGYFCRKNRRLRAAKRDLAKQRSEQLEKAAKRKAYKMRRAMKDKHVQLVKDFNKCKDRLEVVGENSRSVLHLESVKTGLAIVATAVQEAEKLSGPTENYNNFAMAIAKAKKSLKRIERLVDKEVAVSKLCVPTIFEVLEKHRAYKFLELICLKWDTNPESFNGRTIFVPPDHAFLDEFTDTWEEECWGTHMLNGPYHMQDLYILSNCGSGMMLCANMSFTLNCRLNEAGEYIVWLTKRKQPRRVVRIVSSDIRVEGGSILHFVDKIIYPN